MIFKEEQSFAPWVNWLIFATALIVLLTVGIVLVLTDVDNAMTALILVVTFISLAPVLLLKYLKLKTEIDTKSIRMNFAPLSKKVFPWSDIKSAELIDYGFVGGWGIRIGTKYGTVYNTQGREGLLLKFKDGKSVVIGTQRRDELERFLDKAVSL